MHSYYCYSVFNIDNYLPSAPSHARSPSRMIFSFLAVLLVATGIEGHGLRRLEEPMPTTSATLSKIKERGKLKCGSTDTVGFSKLQEDGSYKGFEVDLVSDQDINNVYM
mmetsp:Transcript_22793/g.47348  ORF Transcript_22793/g.47348 Transcript_22793/m.47348 type:complete len:109 (+) Transcript_22793:193-519(+)